MFHRLSKFIAELKSKMPSDEKNKYSEYSKLILTVLLLTTVLKGTIAEARYIPSGSMLPNLKIQDRVLVEKLSNTVLGRQVERGDILVFYPPQIETGRPDNGLWFRYVPFVPENPPAFIKRVIGLPGDAIRIEKGVGVTVNGQLYKVPGATTPDYDLKKLSDIEGVSMTGSYIRPYADQDSPIIVPPNSYFMLGDNRNASADSHVWGFVTHDRVVGRACLTFWKQEWLSSLFHKGP